MYEVFLKMFGKVYNSKGKTIPEALNNLKVNTKVGGTSILTIKKGKKSKDRILNRAVTTRLLALSPTMKEVTIKNLSLMFDL